MTAELVIAPLNPSHGDELLDALDTLLRNAVESGASVGFLPPLAPEESRAFWQATLDEVASGTRLALGAWLDERLVGTVHLALATKPNGRHRGEVQKLLVHTTVRRRGVAQKLLGRHRARGAGVWANAAGPGYRAGQRRGAPLPAGRV